MFFLFLCFGVLAGADRDGKGGKLGALEALASHTSKSGCKTAATLLENGYGRLAIPYLDGCDSRKLKASVLAQAGYFEDAWRALQRGASHPSSKGWKHEATLPEAERLFLAGVRNRTLHDAFARLENRPGATGLGGLLGELALTGTRAMGKIDVAAATRVLDFCEPGDGTRRGAEAPAKPSASLWWGEDEEEEEPGKRQPAGKPARLVRLPRAFEVEGLDAPVRVSVREGEDSARTAALRALREARRRTLTPRALRGLVMDVEQASAGQGIALADDALTCRFVVSPFVKEWRNASSAVAVFTVSSSTSFDAVIESMRLLILEHRLSREYCRVIFTVLSNALFATGFGDPTRSTQEQLTGLYRPVALGTEIRHIFVPATISQFADPLAAAALSRTNPQVHSAAGGAVPSDFSPSTVAQLARRTAGIGSLGHEVLGHSPMQRQVRSIEALFVTSNWRRRSAEAGAPEVPALAAMLPTDARRVARIIASVAAVYGATSVADIGSGPMGELLGALAEAAPGVEYVAMDRLVDVTEEAARRHPGVPIVSGCAMSTLGPAADVVLLRRVLDFLPFPEVVAILNTLGRDPRARFALITTHVRATDDDNFVEPRFYGDPRQRNLALAPFGLTPLALFKDGQPGEYLALYRLPLTYTDEIKPVRYSDPRLLAATTFPSNHNIPFYRSWNI